ncbi:MAG: thioredoxin family protein [Bacteroidales bacterium]|nr:thioredoxin family protein [Bacteroidales bacterium]
MKRFALLACGWLLATVLSAQQLDPVKWTYTVKETSATEAELLFTAKLDAGWHMYSQYTDPMGPLPVAFEFVESGDYQRLGKVLEPKPHEEMDDVFQCVVKSFSGTVVFRQKVKRLSERDFTVKGVLSYQLCNDGSCIAPEDHDFVFRVKGAVAEPVGAGETRPEAAVATEETPPAGADSAEAAPAAALAEAEPTQADGDDSTDGGQSLWSVFLLALGGGLLTMFTPCVFPMIPMTVNFFMRGSENRRKSRRQAWFFGLSIVMLFAVLGAILALVLGPEALYTLGTHWIPNLIFFIVFFVFALSFFGLFEIKMPERWVNASDEQADKGGFLAPFFIALTTVLVSFSCTGPILGAALVGLTTSSTDRWVSLVTMLGFGIGFAAPFTLLAMFPQFLKNMKSGSWLNTVKVVFAFLELAFGLKFLQQADLYCNWGILDREVYLALWIVIFGLLGLYLLGKLRFKGDDPVERLGTGRLMLAIVDLAFVVYMVPGLWGAPLKGISGFLPPMESQDFNIERIVAGHAAAGTAAAARPGRLPAGRKYADKLHVPLGFEAFFDLEEARAYARETGKPLFLDFTGKTCANCREMEHYVWVDPEVKRILNEEYVMVSLYCDENTIELPEEEWVTDAKGRTLKTLGRRNLDYEKTVFDMNAQPYYVVTDAEGRVLTRENYKYNRDASRFAAWLREGASNHRASVPKENH